jgi:hypothetical protein
MKSEGNNMNADNRGFKKGTDDHANDILVGSVGIENGQDNGASTLRELRRKRTEKSSQSTKNRRPLL